MFESYEFWALIISILGGDMTIFWANLQMKNEISQIRLENANLRSDMEMEFARCRIHECNTKKE